MNKREKGEKGEKDEEEEYIYNNLKKFNFKFDLLTIWYYSYFPNSFSYNNSPWNVNSKHWSCLKILAKRH